MSFYLPPSRELQKFEDNIDQHRTVCAQAIKEYLEFIDIQLKSIEVVHHSSSRDIFSMYAFSTMKVNCICDIKDYKYFEKFSYIIARASHPKIDKDTLFGCFYIGSSHQPTIFEYDIVVEFQFKIETSSIKNMNDAVFMLKEATEELRYKKYSASFDKEVQKELDSNT
jgi:hypothetical protein